MPPPSEVTQLLRAWQNGDEAALETLTSLVQKELYRLARRYMAGERIDHTLQPTALINEAWMRLIDWRNANWQNRAHFFAISAQIMRHILVDHARRRSQSQREGERKKVSIDEALEIHSARTTDLVALDDALNSLSALDARKGKI